MEYGYFDDPIQLTPTYDPGLDVECPICERKLSRPMKTISLMAEADTKSYFYRVHKECYEGLTDKEITDLDSIIISFVALRS